MQINQKMAIIEAILFANGESLSLEKLSEASGIESETVVKLINALNDRYEQNESALNIIRLGDAYQLATKQEFGDYITAALENKRKIPLSPAAMETLTIIAYNQPVTKGFVEHVRGVDSSSVVNSLVEKNLLEEAGRLDVPGKPVAYRTTDVFLRCFQLSSLDDLPPLPNMSDQVSFDEIKEEQAKEQTAEPETEPDIAEE
ncbi:MAG: SMC-Scp complex subunit ScpB [Ruminococcus sp.]|nr:SMC-Scp complex subunit ScpB [Ruminococcus sp.]